MCRKRASSFSEERSHAEASSSPLSKRARFLADGGSPKPRGVVDSDLVAVIRARFPSVRLEVMPPCSNPFESGYGYYFLVWIDCERKRFV